MGEKCKSENAVVSRKEGRELERERERGGGGGIGRQTKTQTGEEREMDVYRVGQTGKIQKKERPAIRR